MSEESTEKAQPESPEESFANLRKQKEELAAKYEAALPILVDETIRSTGVDPASRDGLMMKELLGNEPDAEKAAALKEKFNLGEPEVETTSHTPTEAEQRQLTGAATTGGLETVSQSQTPVSRSDRIAQAQAAFDEAKRAGDTTARLQWGAEINRLNAEMLVEQIQAKK